MGSSGETDVSDNIKMTLHGKTVTIERFWNTPEWYRRPYLGYESDVEERLMEEGLGLPHVFAFLDVAIEDWQTWWRKAGSIMRDFRQLWIEELGFGLARDEFKTRITQKVTKAGGGEDTEEIVSHAMAEYDDYEGATDGDGT